MKRTAKYETLVLHVGKWHAFEEIARAYAEEKDRALLLLGRAVNWHFLDDRRSVRTAMKGSTTSPRGSTTRRFVFGRPRRRSGRFPWRGTVAARKGLRP